MKNKFNEVINDILEKIDSLEYSDIEKNIIKTNIMMNLSFLCKDEKTFEHGVYALRREHEHQIQHRHC